MNCSLMWVLLLLGLISGCGTQKPSGDTILTGQVTSNLTLSGRVRLTETATVAEGATLTLAEGTEIRASEGAALVVQGTLVAEGTEDDPVDLSATVGDPGSWTGLVVQDGGSVTLTHIAIHEATVGFKAEPGSSFAIDHILIDTSSSLLALASGGTLAHGTLRGIGNDQQGKPIVIESASPAFSDTFIGNANAGVDIVNVNGASASPAFDHVEITQSHCAFHFDEGSNITIKNSYIHDNEYGMMVIDSLETKIRDSNFESNVVNIGTCAGGSVEASGVYFTGDAFDGMCAGQTNTSPATARVPDSGPRK
jgi:hypothetical protein